jgi:hypothetical protein
MSEYLDADFCHHTSVAPVITIHLAVLSSRSFVNLRPAQHQDGRGTPEIDGCSQISANDCRTGLEGLWRLSVTLGATTSTFQQAPAVAGGGIAYGGGGGYCHLNLNCSEGGCESSDDDSI